MNRHLRPLLVTSGSLLAGSLLLTQPSSAGDRVSNPPELGQIAWCRDFDGAATEARRENKPILVLFQEVPG